MCLFYSGENTHLNLINSKLLFPGHDVYCY